MRTDPSPRILRGVVLADAAKHVADALAEKSLRDREAALAEIARSFASEIAKPTPSHAEALSANVRNRPIAAIGERSQNGPMDISLAAFAIGLLIGSAMFWAPFFALAYYRRRFGGTPRGYLLGFAITWLATVALFALMTVWENR